MKQNFEIDPRDLDIIAEILSDAGFIRAQCLQPLKMLDQVTEDKANEIATNELGRLMGQFLAEKVAEREKCITRVQLPEARVSLIQNPYEVQQRMELYVMSMEQWHVLNQFLISLLHQRNSDAVCETAFE